LSEEGLMKVLRDLGLSRREAEIYIFLSRRGPQAANSVSTMLKIERVQTYRALKSLQEKGIIETTLETPTRFSAVPFDGLLNSLITTRKGRISELETQKEALTNYWKNLSSRATEYPLAKFRVLTEKRAVHNEILRMTKQAKDDVVKLATGMSVIQEDFAGILDSIIEYARRNKKIQIRILTGISKDNDGIIEQMMKTASAKKLNIQWRHTDLGSRAYPQFLIKDREETLLYVTPEEEPDAPDQPETALWIRSRIFASALQESFLEMWRDATKAEDRIRELKTGKPVEVTAIIKDPEEAQRELETVLEKAEKEVIAIVPSSAIATIMERRFFDGVLGKKLSLKIMAPIDLDNLEPAQELSKTCEVRNVPISYLTMLAADNEHLFIFKTPPLDKSTAQAVFRMDDVFHTNDARYVERVVEMLSDIWKRGVDIQEIISGSATKVLIVQVPSSITASTVIDSMLENNVSSLVVVEKGNPIGIITERDLLEKILKRKKDPARTHAKDIMSIPVIAADSDQPLTEALQKMRTTGIRKLAVLRNGRLVGMLTIK
jgi:sugar-specific transcriptional regulator TrmB/predicted transcriptional regulator